MKTLSIIVLFSLVVGCSPEIRVFTDHDPDYDITAFRTFDWSQKADIETNRNPLYYNELNDKRIKTSVEEQLIRRGYVPSEEKPDLMLHYHIIVDDHSGVITEPYGFYGPYWMRMETHVFSYREGTLIIDLMNTKTNHLVWRGWAVTGLSLVYTPDQTEALIRRAAEKIFRNFPAAKKPPTLASKTGTN